MTLENIKRRKLVRQELEFTVGPCFTKYEGHIQHTPEDIEAEGFFDLCYNVFKPGDMVEFITSKLSKADTYTKYYSYLITKVDKELKKVDRLLIRKIDLLEEKPSETSENSNAPKSTISNTDMTKLATKVADLTKKFEAYTSDTDDQLEEIEKNIKDNQDKIQFLATKPKEDAKTDK